MKLPMECVSARCQQPGCCETDAAKKLNPFSMSPPRAIRRGTYHFDSPLLDQARAETPMSGSRDEEEIICINDRSVRGVGWCPFLGGVPSSWGWWLVRATRRQTRVLPAS